MVEIVMIINNYTVMENKKSDKYVQKNFNFLWSNISLNCNKKGSEFRNQNVMQSWVHLEASIIFALQMTYILYDHMIYLMPLNEHIGYGQIFLFLIAIQNVWYMIFLFYMLLLLLLLCLQRVHERFLPTLTLANYTHIKYDLLLMYNGSGSARWHYSR